MQPLTPGKAVELDVEIWPTSIRVPAGYRIGLTIRGKDYEYGGASGGKLSNFKNELTGCGPFLHNKPEDRPAKLFNGTTTLHVSRAKAPYVLLPVVPVEGNKPNESRTQRRPEAQAHLLRRLFTGADLFYSVKLASRHGAIRARIAHLRLSMPKLPADNVANITGT